MVDEAIQKYALILPCRFPWNDSGNVILFIFFCVYFVEVKGETESSFSSSINNAYVMKFVLSFFFPNRRSRYKVKEPHNENTKKKKWNMIIIILRCCHIDMCLVGAFIMVIFSLLYSTTVKHENNVSSF